MSFTKQSLINFRRENPDTPLIPPDSKIFNVLLLAARNKPVSNDAFDALYTILDFHSRDSPHRLSFVHLVFVDFSNLILVLCNKAIDAGIISTSFFCLSPSFLSTFSTEDLAELVESIIDCLQLCKDTSPIARSYLQREEKSTSLFTSMVYTPTKAWKQRQIAANKIFSLLGEDLKKEIRLLHKFILHK